MSFLFNYHISYQSNCQNATKLPFDVFGMSQQGNSHQNISIGNQDSGGVYIGKKIIIGVVADGCSSGKNIDGFSSNQVGSHIASNIIIKIIRRLLERKNLNLENFKKEFESSLLRQYRRLFNAFSPWKSEQSIILSNLFSSTFIVLAITDKYYCVFHCGDGDVFINGKHYNLSSEQGKYFTNKLMRASEYNLNQINSIKFIKIGDAKKLNNIFISTDGFLNNQIKNSDQFQDFFFRKRPFIYQTGFNDRKAEFRTNLLSEIVQKDNCQDWPNDDATFISIRRSPKS